jgi:hypothetical protein
MTAHSTPEPPPPFAGEAPVDDAREVTEVDRGRDEADPLLRVAMVLVVWQHSV